MSGKKAGGGQGSAKLTFLSQWYAPEPTTVPMVTSQILSDLEFDLQVITGIPNRPNGIVHRGYRAWKLKREDWEGIALLRTPLYPNHSTAILKRMLNYLSWATSATFFGLRNMKNSSVNVVHCTPATTALPPFVARKLFGVPYILIIQDLWPDSVTESGFVPQGRISGIAMDALRRGVLSLYENAAQLVVISPGMKTVLEERGISSDKISVVYNSIDEKTYHPESRELGWRFENSLGENDFVLFYAGNQGAAQDLTPLIKAVASFSLKERVHLVLAGDGVEHETLKALAKKLSPSRIHFVGRVDPTTVRRIQRASDLCVVSLKKSPLFNITMPSKVQSLMAAGLPILGVVEGDAAHIIKDARAGLTASPGDAESIANVIRVATHTAGDELESWGSNGYQYYTEYMSNKVRGMRLSRVINKVLDGHSGNKRGVE